jgi:hypothetical protein
MIEIPGHVLPIWIVTRAKYAVILTEEIVIIARTQAKFKLAKMNIFIVIVPNATKIMPIARILRPQPV